MHTELRAAVDLGIHDERVTVSDHIAYFWETEEEFSEALGFLEVGLRGKDHCVLFGHPRANTKVLAALKANGFDVTHLETEGRITVLGGRPSGTDMLAEIGAAFQTAMAGGAPLIRLLGNIGWGHKDWPQELEILEFEARVTEACKSFPCVVLCMYDVRELSGRIMVHGAYETHPLTVCGNVLRQNPHCVPIETFLTRNKKATFE